MYKTQQNDENVRKMLTCVYAQLKKYYFVQYFIKSFKKKTLYVATPLTCTSDDQYAEQTQAQPHIPQELRTHLLDPRIDTKLD